MRTCASVDENRRRSRYLRETEIYLGRQLHCAPPASHALPSLCMYPLGSRRVTLILQRAACAPQRGVAAVGRGGGCGPAHQSRRPRGRHAALRTRAHRVRPTRDARGRRERGRCSIGEGRGAAPRGAGEVASPRGGSAAAGGPRSATPFVTQAGHTAQHYTPFVTQGRPHCSALHALRDPGQGTLLSITRPS